MTTPRIALLVAVLAGCGASVHRPEKPLPHAVSVSVPAMITRTLSATYERQLPRVSRLSVAVSPGLRLGAAGDYSSRTLASAAEVRFWWTGAPWFRRHELRQMMGFYVGGRLALAHVSTHRDGVEAAIGSTWIPSETLTVGYRVILWRRLELTASQGIGVRHEIDRRHGLPPWTQVGFTTGATAGWLF